MIMKRLMLLSLLCGFAVCCRAQRETRELMTGWRFIRQDAPFDARTDSWEAVSLPHTWNAFDGQDGPTPGAVKRPDDRGSDYFRGVGWYSRSLEIPASWKGRRVFVLFEAVSQIAQVYLNGHLLGEHRGAFTAFCLELTADLNFGGANELRVRADNSMVKTVAPLGGDFDVAGGIYRPVHLIVTDSLCISPTYYASPGVLLTLLGLEGGDAEVEVRTYLSNGAARPHRIVIRTDVRDAAGAVVASLATPVTVKTDNPPCDFIQRVRIRRAHLWNGQKDPYLYSVSVRILDGRSFFGMGKAGALLDEVVQPLGLRTIAVAADGFLLNGAPYPIHGVNRHQDLQDHAWALTPADHDRDLRLMLEMGVTAVRLAHYPQSDYFHSISDRAGMLLWNEVPFVNFVPDRKSRPDALTAETIAFNRNLDLQMREMILQRYNHPSAAFWGLFNELAVEDSVAAMPELEHLNSIAHELDPTRPTVTANNHVGVAANSVADHPCYNVYPGWYDPAGPDLPGKMAGLLAVRIAEQKGRKFALSEYGAGGGPFQHEEGALVQPQPAGPFHPEEWQSFVHESDWSQLAGNPHLWGTFLWAMFDFSSDGRNEGTRPGINDKGMITQDRLVKKDVFFFYQANWTRSPMVHLTSQRLTPRHEAATEVKVYSNCEEVELLLDGRSLGRVRPDPIHVARWEHVGLQPGENHLVAIGRSDGSEVRDLCEWTLAAPAAREH